MVIAFIVLGASLAFGSFIVYSGASNVWESHKRRRTSLAIQGEVTGYEERSHRDDRGVTHVLYAPVCRYSFDGTDRTAISQMASTSRSYQIGESIRLLVDPASGQAKIVAESGDWIFSLGFVIAGTV